MAEEEHQGERDEIERLDDLSQDEKRTYDRLRTTVRKALAARVPKKYEKAVEACLFLPDFAVLIFRLLKDPRVPAEAKMKLALFTAYLASPIDIVPDFIPVLGQFDDLVGAVYVIRSIMKSTPKEVILENWSGQGNVIEIATQVMDMAAEVLGSGVLRKILAYFNK